MTNEQRNSLYAEHEGLIDEVLGENHRLLQACRMNREDMWQELAVVLLESIPKFAPQGSAPLAFYLKEQMRFYLLNQRAPSKQYGVKYAPKTKPFSVLSLDAVNSSGQQIPAHRLDDSPAVMLLMNEIAALPDPQREAITKLLEGKRMSCRNKNLIAARRRIHHFLDETAIVQHA